MNILYFCLGTILVLVGFLLVFVSFQADVFAVERTGEFKVTPAKIFPHINKLKNWNEWSPWAKMDPNCKYVYEGPNEGVGSIQKWNGNNQVGEGQLTITESQPDQHIGMDLEFTRPFACQNQVKFELTPQGDTTKIVWKMSGKNNFMGKVMCLFMNMDKMVGSDFEKGLSNLKAIVEK